MADYTEVALEGDQIRKWNDTRAAMVWHAPAFTHIFYTMMSKKTGEHLAIFTEDADFPTAATDGQHILLKPSSFFNYNLNERLFIICHEISHGMFAHCELMQKLVMSGKVKYNDGKELDYDSLTMNKAMDYVINDMLIESRLGQYNTNWLWDKVKGTHKDDVLTVYRRIYEDEQKNGGNKGGGGNPGGNGQQGFDKNMKPGATTGQDANAA